MNKGYITTLLLLIITSFNGLCWSAPEEELPTIELPEFVISGVERATLIRGNRLAMADNLPEIIMPGPFNRIRPDITSPSIDIVPMRPKIIPVTNDLYYCIAAYGGGFGSFGAQFGLGWRWGKNILSTEGLYDRPPRRTAAGDKQRMSGSVSINRHIKRESILDLIAKVEDRTYLLNENTDQERSWQDFSLNTSITPIHSSIGQFSGRLYVNRWFLNGNDFLISDVNIAHYIRHSKGHFETIMNWTSEKTYPNRDVSLLSGKIEYYRPASSIDWIKVGLNLYIGNPPLTNKLTGVRPHISVTYRPVPDGTAYLKFSPEPHFVSSRSLIDRFPMVCSDLRTIVIEDDIRLIMGYDHYLTDRLLFKVSAQYVNSDYLFLSSRDREPFMYQILVRDFYSVSARFSAGYEFYPDANVEVFTSIERADVDNFDKALMITPQSAGIKGNITLNRWWLSGDISWFDLTPVPYKNRPAHFESNISIGYRIRQNLKLSLEGYNLLNERYFILPGYDVVPLTVMLKVAYGTLF